MDDVYEIINNLVPDLRGINIYLLFDELENLLSYQQVIINEWIKTAQNFTVKVASKFNGMYTGIIQQGQILQDGQDFFTFILDYDLFDPKKSSTYQNLFYRYAVNS